jgi:hypothetical protein
MQAVEFVTELEGGYIKIPESLRHVHSARAKVIILFDVAAHELSPEQEAFEKSGFAQEILLNPSEDIWDRV